jgi:cytochrome c oxidase subunit 4
MSQRPTSHEPISIRTYLAVFVALMVLTGVTIASAHIDLGHGNLLLALIIAVAKAALVVTYFMHLRYGPRMSRAILIAGLIGLLLMMTLFIDDVRTRSRETFLPYVGALNGVRPPNAPVPPEPPLE